MEPVGAGAGGGSDPGLINGFVDRLLKTDGKLDRNWLKGALGDALHAVLCGAGHNIRLLLRRLQCRLRRFCAFILLSILACVRLMLPDRSEMTL